MFIQVFRPAAWSVKASVLIAALASLLISLPLWAQADEPNPLLQPRQDTTVDAAATEDAPLPRRDDAEASKLPNPEVIDLDIRTLIESTEILPTQVDGVIWTIAPQTNRRLLQLPFVIAPGEKAVKLNTDTLRIAGGRLLAWHADKEAAPVPVPQQEQGRDDGGTVARPGVVALPAIEAPPDPIATLQVNAEPPRLTREIRMAPSGEITWDMERVIFSATVKEQDLLYTYKLRPELLEAKAPAQPTFDPPRPGDDRRTAADKQKRMKEQQDEYNRLLREHRAMKRRVLDLPKEIQGPMPVRFWAVFDMRTTADEIEIEGPAPLPWKLTYGQLNAIRYAAKPVNVGADGNVPRDVLGNLFAIKTLVNAQPHPFSLRSAAYVLERSGLMKLSRPGDTVYELAMQILAGNDAKARQAIVQSIIDVSPASPASIELLRQAARNPDPETQLAAIGGLLKGDMGKDPGQRKAIVDATNRILQTPSGPAPGKVIDPLVEAAANQPELRDEMIAGINFDQLTAERLAPTIAAIVARAPASPLAAAWLDSRLLGTQGEVVKRTLTILAATTIDPTVDERRAMDAGGRYDQPPTFTAAPPSDGPRPMTIPGLSLILGRGNDIVGTAPTAPEQGPVIARHIPIESIDHNILKLLSSRDNATRELAWKALVVFVLPQNEQVAAQEAAPVEGEEPKAPATTYSTVAAAALTGGQVPPQAVPFLTVQPNQPLATRAAVRLVVEADAQSGIAAAKALLGSRLPLGEVLAEATAAVREHFAINAYRATGKEPPLVTRLLRENVANSSLASWFGKEVAEGRVPDAAAWLDGYGGEGRMITMLASQDPEVGLGAAAALVASAGGDESMARPFYQAAANQAGQTPDFAQQQWAKARQEIYTQRLQTAAGRYRLIVRLFGQAQAQQGMPGGFGEPITPEAPPGMTPGDPSMQQPTGKATTEYMVGIMEIQADGKSIKFANDTLSVAVPESHLAIRLIKPGELKNLSEGDVGKLDWDRVPTQIDLLPQTGGAWAGLTTLPDGRTAQIILQPVAQGD